MRIMCEIPIEKLSVDECYQRVVNMQRVKRNFNKFEPACLKAVSVSRRADGTHHVYDGMHTLELGVTSPVKTHYDFKKLHQPLHRAKYLT